MIPVAANMQAMLQRRLIMLLNGSNSPQKLLLPLGDLPPSNTIGSAVFAQYTVECPTQFPLGGSSPPPNKWYLGPTQVIKPNNISIGSAIFVWVPNSMLYNAVSIGKKTPKLLLPVGIASPRQRRNEPQR